MTVEPGDGTGEAAEDDLVGEILPCVVDVEAVEGCLVELGEGALQLVGDGPLLASVHPCGEADADDGGDDTRRGHAPVDVDVVALTRGAHEMAEGDETGEDGDDGEEHQRAPHHEGHLLRAATVVGIGLVVALTPEDEVVEAEHIERRHTGHHRHEPAQERGELEAGGDDLVLGEETAERRNARDGEAADEEAHIGDRHVLAQPTHILVEVAAHDHDDGTGAEEEQRLEHGVGEEVEHGCHVAQATMMVVEGEADTQGHEHVGDLRDRGEGQSALDVGLRTGHGSGVEGREGSDVGDPVELLDGAKLHVDGEEAGHLIDTGHDHRGGMDQRRNRRRTLHGVRQPDVEREHRTLARTTDEHQEERRGDEPRGRLLHVGEVVGQFGHHAEVVVERSGIVAIDQDTKQEEQVGEAGDDERLLGGVDGCVLRIVETDEHVGADTHQLPEEIHLEDVGRHHEAEHRHREEREEGVEALEALLVALYLIVLVALGHVAKRVDMDHQGDRGDDQEHHRRDRREAEADLEEQVNAEDGRLAEVEPREVEGRHRRVEAGSLAAHAEKVLICRVVAEADHHQHEGGADVAGYLLRHLHSQQSQQEKAEERQEKYQKCVTVHNFLRD